MDPRAVPLANTEAASLAPSGCCLSGLSVLEMREKVPWLIPRYTGDFGLGTFIQFFRGPDLCAASWRGRACRKDEEPRVQLLRRY